MVTVGDFLQHATRTLQAAGIATARLDTLVFLERALKQNKAWLVAHTEQPIPPDTLAILQSYIARRANREPLAYITGTQEFYGRTFVVTPDVLVPRPETELLVDLLKTLPLPESATLLDVGTGSGAIAITAARELPGLRVEASDTSREALEVARENAGRLKADVRFFASDLLAATEHAYDAIVANLPYVAAGWERSPETEFEPKQALFAGEGGLGLILQLVTAAPARLNPNGYLLLEADPRQFAAIQKHAEPQFTTIRSEGFALVFKKR